ncbi:MAG: hypothetical protein KF724_02655 [Phycisphaeraceae bacterium]|nr:hypothetical protein [Phycisphaeraceae bacterium]
MKGTPKAAAACYGLGVTSAPDPGFFTRYLLENPWPAVIILAVAAVALLRFAIDREDRRLLLGAAGCVAAGVVIFITATLVTTPAEHARRVANELIEAAETANLNAMRALFEEDASIHFGSLTSIGLEWRIIDQGIESLGRQHRIESNSVTRLRAGPVTGGAVAEFGCITTTASSFGPVPSTWLIEVVPGADGQWRIRRLAAVAIAGRAPSGQPW